MSRSSLSPDSLVTIATTPRIDPDDQSRMFEQIELERAHFENAPAVFFRAWKSAVSLAGARFFGKGTQSGLTEATSKWDLQPDLERISAAIGPMSSGERVFLAALTSFYNSQDGARLLQRAGVQGLADLGGLDLQRRTLIAALILTYNGW